MESRPPLPHPRRSPSVIQPGISLRCRWSRWKKLRGFRLFVANPKELLLHVSNVVVRYPEVPKVVHEVCIGRVLSLEPYPCIIFHGGRRLISRHRSSHRLVRAAASNWLSHTWARSFSPRNLGTSIRGTYGFGAAF